METIFRYIKQPSSHRAIIALLGIVGVSLSPEQTEAIVTAAVSVFAVYELLRDSDKAKQ